MLLDLTGDDRLMRTTPFDDECRQLADHHYSRRTVGARQFAYSGRKLVLRNASGSVLWVWMFPDPTMRMDGQTGYNNAIFRNESDRLSSEIVLEAGWHAVQMWGPNRAYTYIDPSKVNSVNPGYCFKQAGWTNVRRPDGTIWLSADGKHLLEKQLLSAQ